MGRAGQDRAGVSPGNSRSLSAADNNCIGGYGRTMGARWGWPRHKTHKRRPKIIQQATAAATPAAERKRQRRLRHGQDMPPFLSWYPFVVRFCVLISFEFHYKRVTSNLSARPVPAFPAFPLFLCLLPVLSFRAFPFFYTAFYALYPGRGPANCAYEFSKA